MHAAATYSRPMPGINAEHHAPYVDPHAKEDERTYALFTHVVGMLGLLDHMFLGLIGTIILWRIKAKRSPFLDDHGREAVNFQLSLLIYLIAGGIMLGIFTAITLGIGLVLTLPIGAIGLVFLYVLRLVGGIRGAMFAARGQYYRYPMTLRLIPEPTD